MRSPRVLMLLWLVVGVAACEDAMNTVRGALARTLRESSHSSRRAALAAAQDLPPLERQRQKLKLYAGCARALRGDIEQSWRTFQAVSAGDDSAESKTLATPLSALEQCVRTEIEAAHTPPRFPDLEEALEGAVQAAEAYEAALDRYASITEKSGSVESLAPERNALASALENAYIGWSVSVAALEKRIAEHQMEVDGRQLERTAEQSGKRAAYFTRGVQFAVTSARDCIANQHTVHGCLDRIQRVANAIEEFQVFFSEHEAAQTTVYWLPHYRREVERLKQANDRLIERANHDGEPKKALTTWLERSEVLGRQARHLRFDRPHPVRSPLESADASGAP